MTRGAMEREPGSRRERVSDSEERRLRTVKREKLSRNNADENAEGESAQPSQQNTLQRRVLRSKYLAVMDKLTDQRDDLTRADSKKFDNILKEVQNLHRDVQNPREQVADAEALLDITSSLVSSVKSQSNDGVTPGDFVCSLLAQFGQSNGRLTSQENAQMSINWQDIGLTISPFLLTCHGCSTMLGTMKTEVKQRKVVVRRKREKPTQAARPEEVDDAGAETKTDTDKNMSVMFDILRRKKSVSLESLILNRKSFAQTVENLFALSFLVKDGRVEIAVNEQGCHLVAPRNAPASDSIMSGKVKYSHFVFRYDFKDWKLMKDAVPIGEELMPHREVSRSSPASQTEQASSNTQGASRITPIRKLSRNRGLVIREDSVVEDSPEDDLAQRPGGVLRCRRKII